ncbi:sialidase family protein [Marinicrinis lubricantis]|uniref:Photosynthesis system II assembly factor Ycf48/Hcf136-like domain-containing protein n=1 Tax=Marinicrinis lubricantis TaxID=2086470 RepID=A0ABW1IP40_9BACL
MNFKKTIVSIVTCILFVTFNTTLNFEVSASVEKNWEWTIQQGMDSSDLNAIIEVNGVKLAVGNDSTIFRSTEAGKWNNVQISYQSHLIDAATNNKNAVIIGSNGFISTTVDGLKWSVMKDIKLKGDLYVEQYDQDFKGTEKARDRLTLDQVEWMDISWDGQQYIAVGIWPYHYQYYFAASSSNGLEWEFHALVPPEKLLLSSLHSDMKIVKFQNRWLALHTNGMFISNDFKTWEFKNIQLGGSIQEVATNGECIVAVGWDGRAGTGFPIGGVIYVSSNGVDWKRISNQLTKGSLNSVIWDGERFITVGQHGTILQSEDGLNWTSKTKNPAKIQNTVFFQVHYIGLTGNMNAINLLNGQYFAVGDVGTIRSTQGLDQEWNLEKAGTYNDLYGVKFNANTYAILGEGVFASSSDGVHWENVDSDKINQESKFYQLTSSGGMFVTSGYQIDYQVTTTPVYLYANRKLTELSQRFQEDILDAITINREIRLFGRKNVYLSKDGGENWETLKGFQAIPVATNGKMWIGYRNFDYYISKDGLNWSKSKMVVDGINTFDNVKKAVWNGSSFTAIYGDSLIESYNGIDWKTVVQEKYQYLHSLAVNSKGVIVAVGQNGSIHMNADRKTWVKIKSPTLKELRDVTWDGEKFIAVGNEGVIIVGRSK